MTIESGTYLSDLNVNYPETNALISGGDNHIRWIKSALKNTFPNVGGAITASHTTINSSIASVVAATNANTANTLVKRDANGNISAGNISGTSFTSAGGMTFPDGQAANFGTGNDLQIFHINDKSYIDEAGPSGLLVRSNNLYLQSYNSENYLVGVANGPVSLYYDNAQKLATTATGIDVSGTATMNGLNVDSGTLQVDASNNRIGVNTAPSHALHINSGSTDCVGLFESSDSTAYISVKDNGTSHALHGVGAVGNDLTLYANNAERLRIDSSGTVKTTTGEIIAGDVNATGGGTALKVRYSTGHSLNNFGAMYSGADTMLGFGVESSKTQANKFISTASNSNFARGALTIHNELKFFSAGAQTTAVGSEVSMTEQMRIDASGKLTAKNATFDNGTNTTVDIRSDDDGKSELRLFGNGQGTGRLYVGQSSTHGGGIEYNGDSNPVTAGGGSDYTTLFRRSSGTDYWTARNSHSNNNWEFSGNISAQGSLTGAIKTNLLNEIYPIGAIYISTTSTSPATLFGGTWSAIGGGRVLQTVSGSSPSAGANYSSNTRSISESNMPAHKHIQGVPYSSDLSLSSGYGTLFGAVDVNNGRRSSQYGNSSMTDDYPYTSTEGSGTAFNVQQASFGVYMWRRTGLA